MIYRSPGEAPCPAAPSLAGQEYPPSSNPSKLCSLNLPPCHLHIPFAPQHPGLAGDLPQAARRRHQGPRRRRRRGGRRRGRAGICQQRLRNGRDDSSGSGNGGRDERRRRDRGDAWRGSGDGGGGAGSPSPAVRAGGRVAGADGRGFYAVRKPPHHLVLYAHSLSLLVDFRVEKRLMKERKWPDAGGG
jgi:hypothetical protein